MTSEIYSQVNNRVLAALEQGIIPWKRPWTGRLPTNYDSGKEYRGVNILTLGIAEMVKGYSSTYWLTFRQAQKHGVISEEVSELPILYSVIRRSGKSKKRMAPRS